MFAKNRLIVALDGMSMKECSGLVGETREFVQVFKVGLGLYYHYGPAIVKELQSHNVAVFLDLKLNDIPMQVAAAVTQVANLSPRFLTVHALGGAAMMEAAVKEARARSIDVLVVSALTSIDEEEWRSLGFGQNIQESVVGLTKMAYSMGARGFVCSPHEAFALKQHLGPDAFVVCPGIRGVGAETNDQKRTMGAYEAVKAGADWLVVGRPITGASDPKKAAYLIQSEIDRAQ
jgi:orotidine-5'-phosphate decarboxylase